jgi:MFS transporter, OPA family, sugar phosphate sensor protein UhpC
MTAVLAPGLVDLRSRRLRWEVFFAATIGYSLYYVCRLSLSVIKAPLATEGVFTESQLGLIGSAFFYAYAVGKFVNGFFADGANINRFLTVGLLGTALANLLLGFGSGFIVFAALWLVSGWFQSMGAPACVVGLSRWFDRAERGTYYGLWSASHNIGEGLTFIGVALLTSYYGWRSGFWGAATMGFAGAAIVFIWFHDRPPPACGSASAATVAAAGLSDEEKRAVRRMQWAVLKMPSIWLIAAASALMYVSRYSINSWGIFFLELSKGYSRVEAGTVISVSAVAGVLGTVGSGWVSDRWFTNDRFLPALLASVLGVVSLAAFLATPPGYLWMDYASMVGFGIAIGALICYLGGLLAVDSVPKEVAGAALGMVGIASYIGAGTQDIVSGYLIEAYKVGEGAGARYEFLPAGIFWVGALIASTLLTLSLWRASRAR